MQIFEPSIFARHDTLLGICQALGDDLRINPTWLRVALASLVFVNLAAAVAIYLVAGAVVLASRLLYRTPRKPVIRVVEAAPAPVEAENDYQPVLLAEAA